LDAYHADPEYDPESDLDDNIGDEESVADAPRVVPPLSTFHSGEHFILGSCKGVITIGKLLRREASDNAFKSFCSRVSTVVKSLSPSDTVVIDELCKVCYYSLVHID